MGNITNLVWVLPRPRKDHYPGGFPMYFERKLLQFLPLQVNARVLHPFGGMAEYGLRIDVDSGPQPDILATAESLPFRDNSFDLVICDPPYDDEHARAIYKTKYPRFKLWGAEAVRVCKEYGFICLYHWLMMPRLKATKLVSRIIILQRTWGRPRVATICQKDSEFHL